MGSPVNSGAGTAAIGLLCQLVGWHAIDGLAVWADDTNVATHEVLRDTEAMARQLGRRDMRIRAVALVSVAGCCVHPAFPVRAVRARTAPALR